MQLVFSKGAGKYDSMQVLRAGAADERIRCPKQGIIPHDMVHFAVESVLHRQGFLGRVRAGEAATLTMPPAAESDSVERLVEVLQADAWADWKSAPDDLLELYAVTCNARRCLPLQLDAVAVEMVRMRILELTAQWQALPVGGTLTLAL